MRIKVLGTKGEIDASAPEHRYHSGVLVDDTLLFDLGEEEFLDYRPKAVFITHFHPDHAFFVTRPSPFDARIYAPEASSRVPDSKIVSDPIEIDGYLVTPVPTHHSKKVKSTAYLTQKDGQKLLYTGDMIWINKEFHHLLIDSTLVVTDGSYLRKGGMIRKDKETGALYGHAGIPNLIDFFRPFTKNILFVHFGNWFFRDIEASVDRLVALGSEHDVNVRVGYDGMELDLAGLT